MCIVMPGEGKTMTVHSSTQHPTEVQEMVAEVLGIPFNQVVTICKRMGGGFGGKETQAAQPAMMAALLAAKTRRPVRFLYTKDDDPLHGEAASIQDFYRVGFIGDGVITALDTKLYSNGGCSTDLSFAVLERAMLHSDNAYFVPNISIWGDLQDEFAKQHGFSRIWRAAGRGGDGEYYRGDRGSTGDRCAGGSSGKLLRDRRPQCDALRADRSEQYAAGIVYIAAARL